MENQFWGKFSELIEGAKLVNAFVTLSSLTQQFNFVQQMNGIPPSLGLRIWFHQNGSKLKDPRLAMRYQKMFCFACYRLDFKFGYVVRLWFLCRSLVRTVIQRGRRPGMILNYKAISYSSVFRCTCSASYYYQRWRLWLLARVFLWRQSPRQR